MEQAPSPARMGFCERYGLPLGAVLIVLFLAALIGDFLVQRWFSTYREAMTDPDRYYVADGLVALLSPVVILSPLLYPIGRALRRRATEKHKRGAIVCCIVLVFLLQLFPMGREEGDYRALTDPYGKTRNQFSVSGDGTTILMRGVMQFGTAPAVQALLARNPKVTTIDMASPGGFAVEGIWLGNLIHARKLNTVTHEMCGSACAYAYAGGIERSMAADARIGLHQPVLAVPDAAALAKVIDIHKRYLEGYGVSADFVDEAFTHPYLNPWFPDGPTLLKARMVTEITPAPPGEEEPRGL